jgi:hypothetical protein
MRIVIVMDGNALVLEVVHAGGAAGCFARGLDRGEQKRNQDADDRDHDEQFD